MQKIVIAIDGYSGCGKSTTARAVAGLLGYIYIDTGAMYRSVTLYFIDNHVSLTDPRAVSKALEQIDITFHYNATKKVNEVYLNGLNVEKEIRGMDVSQKVSDVSAIKEVRHALVAQQRKMGKSKGVVMDGRDIGTVVFPDADLKIFMTADLYVRAERRQKELLGKGQLVELEEVIENLRSRDEIDTSRKESPLKKAANAIEIDTTHITFEEQIELITNLATSKLISGVDRNKN
ncbi:MULTISPECIES: (d)CMP kinase [Imperialibacter]|jgi:CMP/dCMP kinase|uniref:Cytidylate kinase n=1 Tax=Imperialibacter roseus TaxID=1324217 RepID=A0ABZ0IT34_9BACT|nr:MULTISPECIES: (d)CMP kinase [Imperialibacter]WOK07662.1 (d)CMP kinase [Imperialibacter roseus]CAD5268409.1 Cytidylate kinase [Imperialibacter sp. 75]CAD5299794.1 Cytidylate kinase [Imperialibacter sp. 89]VVT21680.1 Cytidylate kinase [Imperialibacter sp. EC-SDR9]|tara:strand:- start:9445 stop:10146 length:702 start_codon:yes stop_codon:yes gene_type:complete